VGFELSAGGHLQGLGAAPGRAAGPVMLIGGTSSEPVPAGAVLVARILHPHLAPLLFRAAAVVVEEGALLQHATVLAREFGIPAVVAVQGATSALAPGEWVEVDGDAGVVRRPGGPQ
jgi:phosphohistidine swiveling domain-containing protein